MTKTKKRRPRRYGRVAVCAIILVCGILLCTLLGKKMISDLAGQESDSVKQAVLRCAVQCYAVEGAYPENLDYMEENYGLTINEKQYIVIYDAFASNLLPQVSVLPR